MAVAWGNDLVPFVRRLAAIKVRIAQQRPAPQAASPAFLSRRGRRLGRGSLLARNNFALMTLMALAETNGWDL